MALVSAFSLAQAAASQTLDTLQSRSLETRFSEEIGVETPAIYDSRFEGPGIPIEADLARRPRRASGFRALVSSSLNFDTNVRQANGGRRPKGDKYWLVAPEFRYDLDMNPHTLSVRYVGNYSTYERFADENVLNHSVEAAGDFFVSKISRLNLSGTYEVGASDRDDREVRQDQGPVRDVAKNVSLDARLTIGRRIATMQIETALTFESQRFLNNDQGGRDQDRWNVAVTAFYNLGPRFSLAAEASRSIIGFRSGSTLDGIANAAAVGVRWEEFFNTSGKLLIGRRERDFDERTLDTVLGDTWSLEVDWAAAPNSSVRFTSLQSTEDAVGSGSQQNTSYALQWNYQFDRRWSLGTVTVLDMTVASPQAQQGTTSLRSELTLNYKLDRGVDLSATFARTVRQSEVTGTSFKRNLVTLQMSARFPEIIGSPE